MLGVPPEPAALQEQVGAEAVRDAPLRCLPAHLQAAPAAKPDLLAGLLEGAKARLQAQPESGAPGDGCRIKEPA